MSDIEKTLLPCPFCSGKPRFERSIYDSVVRCESCGARVNSDINPGFFKSYDAMKRAEDRTAVESWNKRSEASALRDRIATLEKALEPFAEAAASYDPPEGDDSEIAWAHDFTIGSLRRARAELAGKEGGK